MSGDLEDIKLDSETDIEPEVKLFETCFCACLLHLGRFKKKIVWACIGRFRYIDQFLPM